MLPNEHKVFILGFDLHISYNLECITTLYYQYIYFDKSLGYKTPYGGASFNSSLL